MNHSLYQDEILKALPFKRLPWGVWLHTRYMTTSSPETPSSKTLTDLQNRPN